MFGVVLDFRERSVSREELLDAAVWATELLGRDVVGEVATLPIESAKEILLIRAHDGFACECCGFHVLERPPTRQSLEICSACGWEDSDPLAFGLDGSNDLDLDSAQRYAALHGACSESWIRSVTPPPPRQHGRRRFASFEERRRQLLESIEAVFAGVELAGGTTLEDARAADDYDSPRPEFDYERSQAWTDVADERLENCCEYVFLDNAGAFFYLPAAMRYALEHRTDPGSVSGAIEAVMRYQKPPLGAWLVGRASRPQLHFIADVLELIFDPWIGRSPHWAMMGGWSPNDVELMAQVAAAIRTQAAAR